MKEGISFGTDGVRGNSDLHPFTKEALRSFGAAIGHWANEKYTNQKPKVLTKVLIGYDSRSSGPRIKDDLIEGLSGFPIEIVDGGILPTPAIYRLISIEEPAHGELVKPFQRVLKNANSFDFGISISASHNPYQDNGIKIFDAKACKLTHTDEEKIEQYFDIYFNQQEKLAPKGDSGLAQNPAHQTLILHVCHNCARPELVEGCDGGPGRHSLGDGGWPDADQTYIDNIYSKFNKDFLAKRKIVLDCANGATSQIAPQLFKRLGATVITIGSTPSGKNINENCGSTHPEKLQEAVISHQADIGFAFDGDGDRVIAVNKRGQVRDGDDILIVLTQHPAYQQVKEIVATITSNQGFEAELHKTNRSLIRTQVGDKYVAAMLEEKNLPLGGETSGHIIIRDYMTTGDGIYVALKMLESIIVNQNWEIKTFDKYPQISINIPVKEKHDLRQQPYAKIIKNAHETIKDGRIVVRYSGTENLLRIMTEAATDEIAKNVAQSLASQLEVALAKGD